MRKSLIKVKESNRRGIATLDYILVLGVVMPLAIIVIPLGIRAIQLVYEMTSVLITWPFL